MQKTTRRWLLAGGIAAPVVAGLVYGVVQRARRSSVVRSWLDITDPLVIGEASAIPQPVIFDAGGHGHTVSSLIGRGIVLSFWATWCPPCVIELPRLDRLAQRLVADNITVVAVSVDRNAATVVPRFLAAHDISNLAVWFDTDSKASQAFATNNILPTTIIIDGAHNERARVQGVAHWDSDAMIADIRRLVA